MSSNEQLEQPLWELIYELLPPEEEAALLKRITSEPEVARAFAKVQLQADLVAAASRCDDTRGRVVPPHEATNEQFGSVANGQVANDDAANDDAANDDEATDFVVAHEIVLGASQSRSAALRIANRIVAVAAMGLLVISAIAITQLRSPATPELAMRDSNSASLANSASTANADPLLTVVTAPPVWNEDTTNFISVRTSSLDGTPAATPFELKLYDVDGQVQMQESYRTDATGAAQVELTATQSARTSRWEVAASDDRSPPVATSARSVRSGHLTHLTTDLASYQPGETISYRSLSLSRFDHRVDGEVAVEFDVLDEHGASVPGAKHLVTSERGVGDGEFRVPQDTADTKFTILARSPDGAFPEQRRHVRVAGLEVSHWHKELKLARESYGPGDRVEGRLSVTSQDGQPAAGKKLSFFALVDQQPIPLDTKTAITDREGTYDIQFPLPPSANLGEAIVTVKVADDQTEEQFDKAIPIHTGRVAIQFFPEGGELAAGLKNQVYFQASNLQGLPVHVEGRIVDDADQTVAQAVTEQGGRGRFALTTQTETGYRLIVEKPTGAQQELPLPAVSASAPVVLHTTGKVFGPTDDIEITLRMRRPDRSLVLAAACRGSLVGLQAIERSDFTDAPDGTSECQRRLKLSPGAGGVIRVTVYDSENDPPAPVAERLVYRRPAKRLEVKVDPIDPPQPGQQITLGLQTIDETGQPIAAAMGVSVVNQARLNATRDKPANLETHVFLTSEIRGADELEDANFYLGTSDEAATAMDLLLGTQGWRRFEELGPALLAQSEQATSQLAELSDLYGHVGKPLERYHYYVDGGTEQLADPLVPVVLDNRKMIENDRFASPVAAVAASPPRGPGQDQAQEPNSQRWGSVLLVGGLLVLFAIIGLALTRSLARPRMWVPSVAAAGIATVLGILWFNAPSHEPSDLAYAPASDIQEPAASEAARNEPLAADAVSDNFADDAVEFQNAEGLEPSFEMRQSAGESADESADDTPAAAGSDTETPEEETDGEVKSEKQAAQAFGGAARGGKLAGDTRPASPRGAAAKSPAISGRRAQESAGSRSQRFHQAPLQAIEAAPANKNAPPPASFEKKSRSALGASIAPSKQTSPKLAASAPTSPESPAPDRPSPVPALATVPTPTHAAPSPAPAAAAATATASSRPSPEPPATTAKGANSKFAPAVSSSLQGIAGIAQQREKTRRLAATTTRFRRVYAEESILDTRGQSAPATLLWRPLVITDANGRATLPLQLPSTEATYRLRADAHGVGRIGSGQAIINVQQP